MFTGRSTLFRVLATLLLVAILIGAGVAVYQAGFSQGYAQASITAGNQGTSPVMPGFPYRYWWGPGFGFFPFFPLFGLFFFGLFVFFLIRVLFFPRWWGYGRRWGPYPPEDQDRQENRSGQGQS
jgi:hypothetical protein